MATGDHDTPAQHDRDHWTSGVLPSDAKIGTDDPEEEAAQLEGQLPIAGDPPGLDTPDEAAGH